MSRGAPLAQRKLYVHVPVGWSVQRFGPGLKAWGTLPQDVSPASWAQVIITEARYHDGRWWRHLSLSCASVLTPTDLREPTWAELCWAKRVFMGEVWCAYQVIPPSQAHVNITPAAHHLFALADGSAALPDFTCGSGSL